MNTKKTKSIASHVLNLGALVSNESAKDGWFETDYTISACDNCYQRSFSLKDVAPYRCGECGTLRPEFRAKSGVLPW